MQVLRSVNGNLGFKGTGKAVARAIDDHITSTFIERNPYNLVDTKRRFSKL